MSVDFAAILVSLTFITGFIWALDRLVLLPRRQSRAATVYDDENEEEILRELRIVEYARSFFPVILIVLLLRSFLVEPFRIPSNSMMPTLLTGDFILVNKFQYGIRLPVLNTKIIDIGSPQPGDVVVFRYPLEPSVDYIKRVVGIPGDHVVYRNKTLIINGKVVAQEMLEKYRGVGAGISMTGLSLLKEDLEGVQHDILIDPRKVRGDVDMIVPDGQYFVMGDNRDNSNDSRFWGTVPEANLVGNAFMIWMNWDSGVGWGRIGSTIK